MLHFDASILLAATVAIPAFVFLGFACAWLLGWEPGERLIGRVTALAFLLGLAGVLLLGAKMLDEGQRQVQAHLGNWFVSGEYSFPLMLAADRLSLPMLGLTMLLTGLIGSFSKRYLHRERGYFRFFSLLHLFAFGASLVFAAGSFDLLLGGWELVGISSVLLIGFFNERKGPVSNGLRVFGFYRIADLGLLLGIFALHHAAGTAASSALLIGDWPNQSSPLSAAAATTVGLLFVLAASGKSAQVPFSSWLPRAMEGPTPSSAIFYGAISVHMGAYLLLRAQPILALSPVASLVAVGVGLLTAFLGTLSHRVSSDAKTSLTYATMTQVGLIFVEIGLGLSWLALAHIMGHALLRTLQFLRAPSMLQDYTRMHAAAYGQLSETGKHYDSFVPVAVQTWLYRMGLERGYLDTAIDRYVVAPMLRVAGVLAVFEPKRNAQREDETNPAGQVLGEIDA